VQNTTGVDGSMWVKTGDEFVDDTADLSDAAVRTMLDAWHWSARRQLDLRIPKKDARRFTFSSKAEAAIEELVLGKWWTEDEDYWYLAYHPEWQLSKQQVQRRRYSNARAQDRGRRHRSGDHSLCLPGKCNESAADGAADSAAGSDADSARLGSVREMGTTQQKKTTNATAATLEDIAKATGCAECSRRSVLNPHQPPCARHASTR
jgi:hypothetical protein